MSLVNPARDFEMPPPTTPSRYGGKLLNKRIVHQTSFDELTKLASDKVQRGVPHEYAITEFEEIIKGDLIMTSLFDNIFLQVSPMSRVRSVIYFLLLLTDVFNAPFPLPSVKRSPALRNYCT